MAVDAQGASRLFIGLVVVTGLAILGGFGYAAFLLYNALTGSRPEVAAATITGAFTVMVAVVTVTIGRWSESRSQVEKELREKKALCYDKLMQFMFRVLFSAKSGSKQMSEKEMIKGLADFTQQVMIWGADDVVAAWSAFRKATLAGETIGTLITYEDLIYAIRLDLGHSNRGLRRGDVLRLFVNDIDSALAGTGQAHLPEVQLDPEKP